MNSQASLPSLPPASPVRSVDRLGFTLFVAAVVHVAVILGVGFSFPEPDRVSKSLEVTLASYRSDEAPEQADYLAQMNQQGSGSLEHKAAPSTPLQAPFQENEIAEVTRAARQRLASTPPTPKAAVTTRGEQRDKIARTPATPEEDAEPSDTSPQEASEQSEEIASLEAQLAEERERYAKRPKIYRLNAASTRQDKGAWYKEDWRRKVERLGNQNYPAEARQRKLYGSLRMLVSINRNGTLYEVQILESSGQPVLDRAALRIVRQAAPFTPFSGDLSDIDRLEIIRTWRFAQGDRLDSR